MAPKTSTATEITIDPQQDEAGLSHFKKSIELLNTVIRHLKEERAYYTEQVVNIPDSVLFDCVSPDTTLSVLVALSFMVLGSVDTTVSNLMFVDGR